MATQLSVPEHLAGLHAATVHFARYAAEAGLDVDVPTCPGWTVRRLIGHQGAVHRWATGAVLGRGLADESTWAAVAKRGRSCADPVEWLRDGVVGLVSALAAAPDDLEAPVFLLDAPAPRAFWARRQCHETTVHAVDALAASLGRPPRAEETWLAGAAGRGLALDGLDELLCGFVPRGRSRLRSGSPVVLAVRPSDADHGWSVAVSDEPPVVVRHDGEAPGDLVVTGTAAELYLGLWHRTSLESDIWPLWHDSAVL